MFIETYKCDCCGRCENVSFGPITSYRLDDGREIPCMTQPVWCYECGRVCDAEVIINADRIENYINHLRQSGITDDMRESAEILEKSAEEQFEERIDQATTRLEWRRDRESPPKCLECGFTTFLELIPDPNERLESFVHPRCGGTFQYVTSMHASPRSEDILDTEGRRLETQTGKPSGTL